MRELETFSSWVKDRHEYAKDWKKRTGGRVLGYFCTYVPEEILYAAGVLPVRVLGSHEPQNVTEPHIFGMFCPFCRDCLAQGLKGRYSYLDGLMIAQSCLHIRQAYTSWVLHIPIGFSYYLCMPHKVQSKRSYKFLRGELETFKNAVEKWTGRKIEEAALREAIQVYNENRRLMRQLFDLRKREEPPISGEEAMTISLAEQMVDKKEHNAALKELLGKLPQRKRERPTGTRLMIVGSEDDDLAFLHMVENLNKDQYPATFVIDEHCTGTRYFWNEAPEDSDPLMAIARRYIERPPCPSKDWEERKRIPHILQLARDFKVQGAIVMQQKFCDPHELDTVAIRKALEKEGIKTLFLEFDVTVPAGQFRIRVEAFLETLKQEDLF
ncbi:MAG: benzoyl-CoA reductase, bzd-type, subunit N [Thermoplasmata archaeon]